MAREDHIECRCGHLHVEASRVSTDIWVGAISLQKTVQAKGGLQRARRGFEASFSFFFLRMMFPKLFAAMSKEEG